jgi:4-hydroxy-tetrahydrodipicolinate reductase
MKIALVGYGKMGKTIEQAALQRQHSISYTISQDNIADLQLLSPENTDVVIEFTQPEAAFNNVATCLAKRIPVVCGTTGWLQQKYEADTLCLKNDTAFLHASNFSIGVNLFFKLNQYLATLMNPYPQYEVEVMEVHHLEKRDAPSGTAIVIADGILNELDRKNEWILQEDDLKTDQETAITPLQLPITALRLPEVPGTHTVSYTSKQDSLVIMHEAHNRNGFALGAVIAAEWLQNKKGVFSMADVIAL